MIHTEKANVKRSGPSVARMCELLEVSRSGYYDWAARQATGPGPRQTRLLELAGKVTAAHDDSDGVYGAPRITAELEDGLQSWIVELGPRGHVNQERTPVSVAEEEVGDVSPDSSRHDPLQPKGLCSHLGRLSRDQQVAEMGELVEALAPHRPALVGLGR